VVLKVLANANTFFTIDIDSVDGNSDVTCPEVADGEHCPGTNSSCKYVKKATGNRSCLLARQGIMPPRCKKD
jgi:hypothetical protein